MTKKLYIWKKNYRSCLNAWKVWSSCVEGRCSLVVALRKLGVQMEPHDRVSFEASLFYMRLLQ